MLRRPSLGAWLANQLARSHSTELDELLELGEALRAAQDALDGAELRTMSKRRREVVSSLAALAQGIAADANHKVGDAALRELEATLEAANQATRDAEKQRREAEQAHRAAVRARESARRAVAVARKRAERE